MKKILREETAFNGNTVCLEYVKGDLGNKYKIRFQKPEEYGFCFDSAWATIGEANSYFNKLIRGGMR